MKRKRFTLTMNILGYPMVKCILPDGSSGCSTIKEYPSLWPWGKPVAFRDAVEVAKVDAEALACSERYRRGVLRAAKVMARGG